MGKAKNLKNPQKLSDIRIPHRYKCNINILKELINRNCSNFNKVKHNFSKSKHFRQIDLEKNTNTPSEYRSTVFGSYITYNNSELCLYVIFDPVRDKYYTDVIMKIRIIVNCSFIENIDQFDDGFENCIYLTINKKLKKNKNYGYLDFLTKKNCFNKNINVVKKPGAFMLKFVDDINKIFGCSKCILQDAAKFFVYDTYVPLFLHYIVNHKKTYYENFGYKSAKLDKYKKIFLNLKTDDVIKYLDETSPTLNKIKSHDDNYNFNVIDIVDAIFDLMNDYSQYDELYHPIFYKFLKNISKTNINNPSDSSGKMYYLTIQLFINLAINMYLSNVGLSYDKNNIFLISDKLYDSIFRMTKRY